MDGAKIDGWMVEVFIGSHASAGEIVLDLDATMIRFMESGSGSTTVTTANYCYLPLYIFRANTCVRRLRRSNIDGAMERWTN